jgi:hypothetical protein
MLSWRHREHENGFQSIFPLFWLVTLCAMRLRRAIFRIIKEKGDVALFLEE